MLIEFLTIAEHRTSLSQGNILVKMNEDIGNRSSRSSRKCRIVRRARSFEHEIEYVFHVDLSVVTLASYFKLFRV